MRQIGRIRSVTAHAPEVQQKILRQLLAKAKNTEWGKHYAYATIRDAATFASRVPLQDYDSIKPYIDRMMRGERNVLWPSEIRWFAKSSGTTSDKSKFIPVSRRALHQCHYKGARDVLAMYCHNNPHSRLFDGKVLIMGGSHQINVMNKYSRYGDVSAVMMQNMPFFPRLVMTPSRKIALMDEWESKIDAMAKYTLHQHVTAIAGVPTWTIVLIRRLFEMTGKQNLKDIWPGLELYIHGGVSFTPYRKQFNELIRGNGMHYVETYNASEGFFAFQDRLDEKDLLLMPDYGIFYEFIPPDEFDSANPKTLTLGEVQPDTNYAVVISTNAGLWRYKIGDTVKFTSTDPYRLQISGRVKHFINAFGEEVIVDNADHAISMACEQTGAKVIEYTAAPIYIEGDAKGGHEWIVEFEKKPADVAEFTRILDRCLQQINSDYEAKRHKDLALQMPVLHVAPRGTFYRWLREKGKLGGQHKIPRLSNNRNYLEEIMKFVD